MHDPRVAGRRFNHNRLLGVSAGYGNPVVVNRDGYSRLAVDTVVSIHAGADGQNSQQFRGASGCGTAVDNNRGSTEWGAQSPDNRHGLSTAEDNRVFPKVDVDGRLGLNSAAGSIDRQHDSALECLARGTVVVIPRFIRLGWFGDRRGKENRPVADAHRQPVTTGRNLRFGRSLLYRFCKRAQTGGIGTQTFG